VDFRATSPIDDLERTVWQADDLIGVGLAQSGGAVAVRSPIGAGGRSGPRAASAGPPPPEEEVALVTADTPARPGGGRYRAMYKKVHGARPKLELAA
jgi:hypothetical protein